jgi:hypothetical protein
MRGPGAAVIAAAAVLVPAATGNVGGADWATAIVSPGVVNHGATLTLKLHYEMTCRQPGAGPVFVHLPAKMGAPRTLSVRVGAKPAPATVSGHDVTVQLPKPPAITCMSIGMGTLTLYLVGVRNPATPGTYFVRARVNGHAFTAQLAVRA